MEKPYLFKDRVNQRIFLVPDYDQRHVTECWEKPEISRNMSNESGYPPLEVVQQAIREIASKANYYAEDPTYAVSVRKKLAAYARVQPENVTLGNGSIELLDLLFQVLINEPGRDEAILLEPDYSAYIPRITFFGGKIKYAAIGKNDSNTVAQILKNITPNTKFILFSRPNNPMGTMLPKETIRTLLETGVFVIVDEAYIEMAEKDSSVANWITDFNNLIVMRTSSKGFCLAGIRFGYILAHSEMINYINRAKHIFNVNLFAMTAADTAMDHLEELQTVFDEIKSTRDWMYNELQKISGFTPLPSQGNFIMIDVRNTNRSASEFVSYLKVHQFYVRDFSKKAGLEPDTYFRISIGQKKKMEELIHLLKSKISEE